MGERQGVPRNLPAAAALFLADDVDVNWQGKLSLADKQGAVGKSAPDWGLEQDDNNQEENGPHDGETHGVHRDAKPGQDGLIENDELHQLRRENASMAQRLELLKTQHVQRIGALEEKMQLAIATHNAIEHELRAQLETVLHEQQEAVENARKVRKILSRVSTWVRQVQRAASSQLPPPHAATPGGHDLELAMTPRTSTPYTLWTGGETQAAKCNEFSQDSSPAHDSFKVQVNRNAKPCVHSLPPPAPRRNRVKPVPGKGFNYVRYGAASPSNRPAKATKPTSAVEIVLGGLPSVGTVPRRRDTPVPKRGPGSLFAYCAQVVTTSLAGVRSSPTPPAKVLPAWKCDHLSPVREEGAVDEEAGQCDAHPPNRSQHLKVALPNLAIGLL